MIAYILFCEFLGTWNFCKEFPIPESRPVTPNTFSSNVQYLLISSDLEQYCEI
jgi:hypothetical protein